MLMDFSERDILRSKLLTPAYYRVRIDKVLEKTSSAGDSKNYFLEGTIIKDATSGSTEFAGVPTPHWMFNTKAKGISIGFFESLGVHIEPGVRVRWTDVEGKEIVVFIGNKMFEGRMVNQLEHKYMKAEAA